MLISACTRNKPTEEVTATLALTPTPSAPTPTSVPAAAIVNGEIIPLAWYESELQRYLIAQEAAGTPVTDQAAAGEKGFNRIDQSVPAGARCTGSWFLRHG